MKRFIAAFIAVLILISGSALAYYGCYDIYDLYDYEYRPVVTKGRGSLVFQREPRGSFMSAYSYTDGDWVFVNPYYREGNYALAYCNGVYGYVDASYIDWNYYVDPYYFDPYDLYYYEYHSVVTKGRGNLVFQREPRGSFMSRYSYSDGDVLLVNPYYREGNYVLAYDGGTYGYVDMSYIAW